MYQPPQLDENLSAAEKAAREIDDKLTRFVKGDEQTASLTDYECAVLYLLLRAHGWSEEKARRVQRTEKPK